jgi:hypothetical protein
VFQVGQRGADGPKLVMEPYGRSSQTCVRRDIAEPYERFQARSRRDALHHHGAGEPARGLMVEQNAAPFPSLR